MVKRKQTMKTLSNKKMIDNQGRDMYFENDVKQFIKDLKEKMWDLQLDYGTLEHCDKQDVENLIDKLAGDKLLEETKNE